MFSTYIKMLVFVLSLHQTPIDITFAKVGLYFYIHN
jgi:hypothetical protein